MKDNVTKFTLIIDGFVVKALYGGKWSKSFSIPNATINTNYYTDFALIPCVHCYYVPVFSTIVHYAKYRLNTEHYLEGHSNSIVNVKLLSVAAVLRPMFFLLLCIVVGCMGQVSELNKQTKIQLPLKA